MKQSSPEAGLELAIELPGSVVVGLPVLVTFRLSNRGPSTQKVSSRLNLMEGDVRLRITGPDGTQRVVAGAGGQPDTPLRRVTLAPGQQILATSNILLTSEGDTFVEPGLYTVLAEYARTPVEWIASAPVTVEVRVPQAEDERALAALLASEPLKQALTLAQADEAPEQLRDLAERFPGSLAGELARMVSETIAASEDARDLLLRRDPLTVASWISALSTPFSSTGKRLAADFAAQLARQDSGPEVEKALRIAQGQPIDAD